MSAATLETIEPPQLTPEELDQAGTWPTVAEVAERYGVEPVTVRRRYWCWDVMGKERVNPADLADAIRPVPPRARTKEARKPRAAAHKKAYLDRLLGNKRGRRAAPAGASA